MAFVSTAPLSPPCGAPTGANNLADSRVVLGRTRRALKATVIAQAVKKTYSSFAEIIEDTSRPTLVDFYSSGCGPCRMLAPQLGEVGRRAGDKMSVVKIDADKHPSIASTYRVAALPTLVLFRGGDELGRWVGYRDADQIMQDVGSFMA